MIKKLFFEVWKNLSLIFRSLSSLALLVIGPLILILIIGFAFSGDTVHDINIGVISSDPESLGPVIANFTGIGIVRQYDNVTLCIDDVELEKTHICILFGDNFMQVKEGELIPSGTLTFYYDNTRKKITTAILNQLTDYLGTQSEEISIESAKTILGNIQTLVVFLDRRNDDIDALVNESYNIRESLLERKERMIKLRSEFTPKYKAIKILQTNLNAAFNDFNESYGEVKSLENELSDEIVSYQESVSTFDFSDYDVIEFNNSYYLIDLNTTQIEELEEDYNFTLFNESFFTLDNITLVNLSGNFVNRSVVPLSTEQYQSLLLNSISAKLVNIEFLVGRATSSMDKYYQDAVSLKTQFDDGIEQLDEFKIMLDDEIENVDIYVEKIDGAVVNVLALQKSLNENLKLLSKLEPSLAEKLINPVLEAYEAVSPGLKDITLVFPSLLAMVILFISILFANIVTLSEINNRAFLRNMIAPTSSLIMTMGLVITNLIVIMFQVSVLLVVAKTKFDIDIIANLPSILIVCILLSLIFVFAGMIYAYLFRVEQTSILITTFTAIGFFMFSDSIAPLETMPLLASAIAAMNPFVITTAMFKKIIIFNVPLQLLQKELVILGVYAIVLMIALALISVKKNKVS
ncbi:MAG: ABC transporter permease [archaeon]